MSEQLPQFKEIQQNIYENGAKHIYGVDEAGKQTHISHDAVLEAHGYSAAEAKQNRPLTDAEIEAKRTEDLIAEHAARATPSMIRTAKAMASAKEQDATPEPAEEMSAGSANDEKQDFLAPYVAKATPQMRATARAMVQGRPSKPAETAASVVESEIDEETKAFLAPYVAKSTPSMQRTAHAMEKGKYPQAESAEASASEETPAVATSVPIIEVADKAADRPRRTEQLVADTSVEDEYAKHDFSSAWDNDASWDGYDEKLPLRQRLANRWKDIKVRASLLASRDIKGAFSTDNPETQRVSKKLLIGATAVAMAGVAAVFIIKRGDIDLLPTDSPIGGDGDGVGFDLFGRKLGNGTNSHATSEIVDALTPNGGQSGNSISESLTEHRGGSGIEQLFTVEQGNGYTQEIQDLVPGRTPQQYLAAHTAAIQKFGPDYISGVEHYVMPNGDFGLQPGNGTMSPEVIDFLQNTLN